MVSPRFGIGMEDGPPELLCITIIGICRNVDFMITPEWMLETIIVHIHGYTK